MAAKYAGQNNETVVVTDNATAAAADDDADADASGYVWQRRMRELQGAIILASLFEFVLGMTGLVGVLLHYIGPLTIASVIVMVALPMVHVASSYAQHNWLIAFLYVRPPQPDFIYVDNGNNIQVVSISLTLRFRKMPPQAHKQRRFNYEAD